MDSAKEALAKILIDEAVLEIAADVTTLDGLRLQYSPYALDIERREKEVAALWQEVGNACTQLKRACEFI